MHREVKSPSQWCDLGEIPQSLRALSSNLQSGDNDKTRVIGVWLRWRGNINTRQWLALVAMTQTLLVKHITSISVTPRWFSFHFMELLKPLQFSKHCSQAVILATLTQLAHPETAALADRFSPEVEASCFSKSASRIGLSSAFEVSAER